MSMFEKASRMKLRFQTAKGWLTVEDLWDLSLANLNMLAKAFNKQIKAAEEEDFLKEAAQPAVEQKLAFEITLHVLTTKKAEQDAREAAADKSERKKKLLEILAKKQDASLEGLSEDDLKAQIAAL